MSEFIKRRERLGKMLLYIIADIIFIEASLVIAIGLWYDGSIPGASAKLVPSGAWQWFGYMSFIAPVVSIIVYALFRMYSNLWKYASIDEMLKIFIATSIIYVSLYLIDVFFISGRVDNAEFSLPKRLLFAAWMFNTVFFVFSRFGYRAMKRAFILISHVLTSKSGCKRVMVIGAGFSGYGVIRGMHNSRIRDKLPVIVIDDDLSKNNSNILGVRVLNGIDRIPELAEKYQIDEIIIAMNNDTPETARYVIEQCTKTECSLKIMPPISDVSEDTLKIRDVNISDLLSREEVVLDSKNISEYLNNRVILVTGGGGSIGSELCRQIIRFNPSLIVIFDIYENNAFELMNELKLKYGDKARVVIRIGSVRDIQRLEDVFREFRPNVVFQAAAHKHVCLCEDSPAEAVKNNVFGTYNVVKCSDKFGVERFVLLSSDKAVNPTNVMGATKRVAELIVQDMARRSETKFMAVRFGNVLGSNGSVIPLFRQQILAGGPVTVRHPDAERFFMTIPEACRLVLQATGLGKTGRIFVLDMGQPVRIEDLAKNLIKLSGLRLDKDIKIVYTSLLPGEKLKEELILAEEQDKMQVTCHKKIFMTAPVELDENVFERQLKDLYTAANNNTDLVNDCLHSIVPNYVKTDYEEVTACI